MARTPLPVDGKSEKSKIYQRIITHPGAVLQAAPGGSSLGETAPTFTPFYVFDARDIQGETWFEVAPGTGGENPRWIKEKDCSRWDKALTLQFADRMGRRSALFFKSRVDLENLVAADDIAGTWDGILRAHEQNPAMSMLVDTEDRQAAVPRDNCSVPCDHIPIRSWPLFHAQAILREMIESHRRSKDES
ncbi:MAG: hypothetical protein LBU39_09075 [Desulfobulbaceae bacterium]|nr:hypothetical protein [Desulfobulbaceae bacterium]